MEHRNHGSADGITPFQTHVRFDMLLPTPFFLILSCTIADYLFRSQVTLCDIKAGILDNSRFCTLEANMAPQDKPEDSFVKIFLLTHLGEEETVAYFGRFEDRDEDGLEWVKPEFVQWSSDQGEGTVESGDLLRLFKKTIADLDEAEFQYFADLQSGTVILAHRDVYTMHHSPETAQDITKLAEESGITLPGNWLNMEGAIYKLMDELTDRGVAWGPIPISAWRSSWCKADLGELHEHEFIEDCGGTNNILRDPEWDSAGFLKKLKEEIQKKQ